jgi:hypothetical protein
VDITSQSGQELAAPARADSDDMRSVFSCVTLVLATAHISMAADPRVVTNGSDVRVRTAPDVTASISFELPLGTDLIVLDRSTSADLWFRVRTDDGREGWVLGRLTTSVDSAHYGQAVESIVLAQLKNHAEIRGTSFPARVQLFDLIERAQKRLTAREDLARFALYRLRSMRDVLSGVPFGDDRQEPYQTWITWHYDDIRRDEPSGTWMPSPDYVLHVHEEYPDTLTADDIAWFYAENGLPGECEGDVACYVANLNSLYGEYLREHPRGRHAGESKTAIVKALDSILEAYLHPEPGDSIEIEPATCGPLGQSLDSLKAAVARSTSVKKGEVLERLDRMAALCRQ